MNQLSLTGLVIFSPTQPRTGVLGYFQAVPTPDFLWNLVALANFMRLSLLKGAYAAVSCAGWQEIRVRDWTRTNGWFSPSSFVSKGRLR